jgi:hypothetical protein
MGRFTLAVLDYLDTCDANKDTLSPKYHPTENGAVKSVFHRTPDEAEEIRGTFRTEHRKNASRKGR